MASGGLMTISALVCMVALRAPRLRWAHELYDLGVEIAHAHGSQCSQDDIGDLALRGEKDQRGRGGNSVVHGERGVRIRDTGIGHFELRLECQSGRGGVAKIDPQEHDATRRPPRKRTVKRRMLIM